MKLPIDQSQINEQKPTKVKGGLNRWVVYCMIALIGIVAGYYAGTLKASNGSSNVEGICEHGYKLSAECKTGKSHY
ncbi:hypothetical protein ABW636_19030 [Aquimarina sp. 2201CG1-2-11]|uniref:hypothetical protein n=1 Tax=Aquimarina discodermiae TaxID=3231043 RepID=UPI0034635BC3